ncbi:hypothetical protein CY34DRAFT_812022, partial [Suillus luteus UH-Slu-Lm8-n1]
MKVDVINMSVGAGVTTSRWHRLRIRQYLPMTRTTLIRYHASSENHCAFSLSLTSSQ